MYEKYTLVYILKALIDTRGLKKEIVLIDCTKRYQAKAWLYTEKGNKTVESVIVGIETVPTAVERQNKESEELNWRNIVAKCHKLTSDSQLRWFQVRLLHILLPANRYLLMRKIIDTPLCTPLVARGRQQIVFFEAVILHRCFGLN